MFLGKRFLGHPPIPPPDRSPGALPTRIFIMPIVAGVDFGTLSVRVSIVDSVRGRLGSAVEEYPLHRKREDPDYATQSHEDHMRALAAACRKAISQAGIDGASVESI